MATATVQSYDTELITDEEYVKCFLCKKIQKEPKLVRCKHSFCRCCLEKVVSERQFDHLFHCPICKSRTLLLKEDIQDYQDNILINNILNVGNLPGISTFTCLGCDKEALSFKEGYRCLDCGDNYCSKCQEFHCYTSMTKNHRVVSVKELKADDFDKLRNVNKPICHKHSTPQVPKAVDIFCKTCKILICQKCVFIAHKGHDCIDPETHLLPIKQGFQERTNSICVTIEQNREILKQEFKQLKEKKKQQGDRVREKAEELFIMMEAVKQEKLDTIQKHYDMEIKRLEQIQRYEEETYLQTKSKIQYVSKYLEYSPDFEFYPECKQISYDLCTIEDRMKAFTVTTQVLEVENEGIETLRNGIKAVLGTEEIQVQRRSTQGTDGISKDKHAVVIQNGRSEFYNVERLALTDSGDIITRITTNSGTCGLLICNDFNKPKIFVPFPKSIKMDDVVVKDMNIYVSDTCVDSEKVHILGSKGDTIKSIFLPKQTDPSSYLGIAVNENGTMYVCSWGNSTIFKCEVNQSNFELFLSNESHKNLFGPHYLCTDISQNLVVSNSASNTIQAFSEIGALLWEYQHDQLKEPYRVCCDKKGRIFIASHENNQIHVVSNGSPYHVINLEENWYPMALAFTKEGHLIATLKEDKKDKEGEEQERKEEEEQQQQQQQQQQNHIGAPIPEFIKISLFGKLD